MNIEDYREFCLSLGDDIEEKLPFTKFKSGEGVLVFYVCGHMFSFFDCNDFHVISLKCQPDRIDELKAQYDCIGNPYNESPKHWIGIDPTATPDHLLKELTRNSYEIVRAKYKSKWARANMNKSRFWLALFALSALPAAAQQRPNILFIMCDDMGYGDLSCYGQRHFITPNIDQLAQQGMRMTSAYAGSPVSAPSRASLMTGQHTGHTHVRGNKEYWHGQVEYGQNQDFAVVGQEPYDAAQPILPEILKAAGYRTGLFGKWAGGYEGSPSTPDKRGIDEFYGYICQFQAHLYFPNFLNRFSRSMGDTCVVREVLEQNIQHEMYGDDYANRQQYSADLIHQRALEWLRKQEKGKPFLGIFTYTLPHAELCQPDDSLLQAFRGKLLPERVYRGDNPSRYNPTSEAHAQFAAMITRLDTQVGEIMQLLDERGLSDNTVLIFTSDNGPHEEGGADPEYFNHDGMFRGLKRSTHEGGIRIPFIVRWPGHVQAGSESNLPFAFYDLLPTFCDMAQIRHIPQYGLTMKKGKLVSHLSSLDGISIMPTLIGKGYQRKHDHLYWEFHETDMLGVRYGNWKLVVKHGKPSLYNLAIDPHEDHDLADRHPGLVRKLVKKIYTDHTDSPLFPVTLPPKD